MDCFSIGEVFKYAFALSAGVGLAGVAVAGTVKAVKSGAHRLVLGKSSNEPALDIMADDDEESDD